MSNFSKVKEFLLDLDYNIVAQDDNEELVIIEKPEEGIFNMVVDCEDPILILEQHIFDLEEGNPEIFQKLLQKNREIIHGAFVLDETGKKVLFRDTLQIENLDRNELEGSLNSLSLLLSEYSFEILSFARQTN